MTPIWIICPVLNNLAMTMDAIGDFLDQSVPTRVLIVNQGSDTEVREALERQAELMPDRLFIWSHSPTLPSLSASWNRALDFVWETGGTEALVVNNDVRIHRHTVGCLSQILKDMQALFVSAVAVTQEQYDAFVALDEPQFSEVVWNVPGEDLGSLGGPDFSCFLLSKAGHQKYRFDEHFIPLYCEDLDMHRRYMLEGDGDKIFSVNLPYLHFASGTLKAMDPEKRVAKEGQINQSRKYYERKWGGPVNQETFFSPFGVDKDVLQRLNSGPTTPQLQQWWQTQGVPHV